MKVLAIEGGLSKELLTYRGRVIVHDNLQELEFLFPKFRDGQVRFVVVELNGGGTLQDGRLAMWLQSHPDMDTVRWPLDPRDFVPLTGETKTQEREKILAALQRR